MERKIVFIAESAVRVSKTSIVPRKEKGVDQLYKHLVDSQTLNRIYPGQVFTYKRGVDGHTSKKVYPDHEVVSQTLYEALLSRVKDVDAKNNFPAYKISIFKSVPKSTTKTKWLFSLINDETGDILLSKDFMEYLRFGTSDSDAFKLADLVFLKTLTQSANRVVADVAVELINELDSNGDLIKKLDSYTKTYEKFMREKFDSKMPMKVEAMAVNVKAGDFETNGVMLHAALHHARMNNVDLAVFPELIVTSYQVLDSVVYGDFLDKQQDVVRDMVKQQRLYFKEDAEKWLDEKLQDYRVNNVNKIVSEFIAVLDEYDKTELAGDEWWQENVDKQTKQAFLLKELQEILLRNDVLVSEARKLVKTLNTEYDSLGMASIIPVAIPTDGKPFNGAYCFRGDGSLAIQVHKQRLADDPSSYFFEKHLFTPGYPNRKHVFEFMGHNIGVFICEDLWQEMDQKIAAKLADSQGGKILDARLKNSLNTSADILINNSASPEQVGKISPQKLGSEVSGFDKGTAVVDGLAFKMGGARSDTREELCSTVSSKINRPLLYLNSLGGIDQILMGGAGYLYNSRGHLRGTSEQFKDSSLIFDFSKEDRIKSVDKSNQGNVILKAEEQGIEELALSIADYWDKNDITFAAINFEPNYRSEFLQRVLSRAKDVYMTRMAEKLYARSSLSSKANQSPEEIKEGIEKTLKEHAVHIRTFVMPTMDPKFFSTLFGGIYSALKHKTEVQLSVIFKPDWLLSVASVSFISAIGLSNIIAHLTGNYIVWPVVNFMLRTLGLQEKHKGGDMSKYTKGLDKNKVPFPEEIKKMKRDILDKIDDKEAKSRTDKLLDLWVSFVGHIENLFTNNLSQLRSYMVTRELNRRDANGSRGLNIAQITGDKKIRGQFASGGIDTAGFAPLQSISETTVKMLYLYLLKKDVAEADSYLARARAASKLRKQLKSMANSVEHLGYMRRIINSLPGAKDRLDPVALKQYELSVWKEIEELASTAKNKEFAKNKIAKLEKSVSGKTGKVRNLKKKIGFGPTVWNFVSTRGNRVAPKSMMGIMDEFLQSKDLSQMVMLKEYFDPEGIFDWDEYMHYIAYNVRRYEKSKHKNQSINGPFLAVKTSGSHKETVSQAQMTRNDILKQMSAYVDEYKSIRLNSVNELERVVGSATDKMISGQDYNAWVERTFEEHEIEQKLIKLAESRDPVLVIDGFNSYTDKVAFTKAKNLGIKIVVVSSVEGLGGINRPKKISDIDHLYVFDTEQQKNEFIKTKFGKLEKVIGE